MCYCPTPTLHLNLALTGDGAFIFSLKKTHSVWFISVLNYGVTENVLINHLLLVIPMSYPCYYTILCPHKPHKHAHTHTHTHTQTRVFLERLVHAKDEARASNTRIWRTLHKKQWKSSALNPKCVLWTVFNVCGFKQETCWHTFISFTPIPLNSSFGASFTCSLFRQWQWQTFPYKINIVHFQCLWTLTCIGVK